MAKLKEQNDRIYEDRLKEWSEGESTDWAAIRAKEKEIDCGYDFEFEDTAIEGIDMSVRLRHCLNAAEIESLEQVTNYSKKELLNFRHFGRKSLEELETLMNEHNLKFKE